MRYDDSSTPIESGAAFTRTAGGPMKVHLAIFVTLLAVACGQSGPAGTKSLNAIASIYEDGDAKTAATELRKFVERNPRHDLAWTILGHAHKDLGDDRQAADSYRRALSINPKRVEAITGMGILARRRGDDEEALRYYRQAVEIDPRYAQAYSSMTVISLRHSRDAEALEYAEKAWSLDQRDPAIAANLAAAYHYNGMTSRRDEMTERAKKLGYRKIETLQEIYRGEKTLRE
jgi:Tfp pilus assembly protein PilF